MTTLLATRAGPADFSILERCDPNTGSFYRNLMTDYLIDAFLGGSESEREPDTALTGVEVGSDAHLEHLAELCTDLPVDLFGMRVIDHLEVMGPVRQRLPGILETIKVREREMKPALQSLHPRIVDSK